MIVVNKKIGTPQVRFNADFYKRAYKQFRQGRWRDIIEMMNQAETDSHVSGCLVGRRAGFQSEWSITGYDDSTEASERALWMRNVLRQLDLRRLFKDIQDAVNKKFSVIDFEWEVVDNRQVPIDHKKVEHRFFRYDEEGKLKIDFGKDLRDIPAEALVCQTYSIPVLFPVLRDYILKVFGIESWAGFIETFGEGMVIGKYPAGSNAKFIDEVETAVNAIASASRGVMPEGSSIDVVETKRSAGDHDKFISNSNRGISIAILGHENAVSQSDGLQVGENLTQFKVKREIGIDDMFFVDSCMQRLIKTIEDRNFGDRRYSIFQMDKKDPVNVKERLDTLEQFFNQGGRISPDEYRDLGLRVFEDQVELVKTPSQF